MSRLIFIETSLRRSPSTNPSASITWRDAVDLILAQILNLLHGFDLGLIKNAGGARVADSVDVGQRNINCLLRGRSIPAMRAIVVLYP